MIGQNAAMIISAITRRPSPHMSDCELTHLSRTPIDAAEAERQHTAYRAALAACGIAVAALPPLDGHPDCAFVEDTAICLPELFVICRPGAASRLGEVASVAAVLPADRPQHIIEAPATIEGGDVLVAGKTIFVGRSTRTNAAGIAALAQATGSFGYRVVAVEVPGALHLKTAATALAPDLLLTNPAWVDVAAFGDLRHIAVSQAERFASNILSVNGQVFMHAGMPQTAAAITAAGFAVTALDVSEFAKAEAGLTCLSLLVPAVG